MRKVKRTQVGESSGGRDNDEITRSAADLVHTVIRKVNF